VLLVTTQHTLSMEKPREYSTDIETIQRIYQNKYNSIDKIPLHKIAKRPLFCKSYSLFMLEPGRQDEYTLNKACFEQTINKLQWTKKAQQCLKTIISFCLSGGISLLAFDRLCSIIDPLAPVWNKSLFSAITVATSTSLFLGAFALTAFKTIYLTPKIRQYRKSKQNFNRLAQFELPPKH